ncbi:MAG TPA: ankyrin repeat domain-containing protein [Chthonomonadaceae bacterium]|nr:ankyrin repeat domain-containing protein [Chthonomonadaceae bacterium]
MGIFRKAIQSWWQRSRQDWDLTVAAEKGDTDQVLALLDQGANIEASRNYMTVLMWAAFGGHADTVRALLKRGAKINPHIVYDWNSFHMAVMGGNPEIVDLFLKQGADVNTKDPEHEITALMYAAQDGHLEVVRLLLDHGAEINARDSISGSSALSYAASPEIKTLLKQRGAEEDPPEGW